MKPTKFLIIGRTASGKSSITRAVCDRLGLNQVISYTTRPRRSKEKDCVDHIFITEEDIEKYQGDIAAYTEINGYKYFTTYDVLDKSDIYVIDPIGVDNLKLKCGNRYRFIEIYIRVPKTIASDRAKQRGDKVKDFKARFESEDTQFREYEHRCTFHYHLRNDRPFEESVEKVCSWIKDELQEGNNDGSSN